MALIDHFLSETDPTAAAAHLAKFRPVTMLGARGLVVPENSPLRQVNTLYHAENRWRDRNPDAARSISLEGARDLIGELIHHSRFDEVPDIEKIRAGYNPENVQMRPFVPHRSIRGRTDFGRQWGPAPKEGGVVAGATLPIDEGPAGGRGMIALRPNRLSALEEEMLSKNPNLKFTPKNSTTGVVSHEVAHLLNAGLENMSIEGHEWPMARTHLAAAGLISPETERSMRVLYDRGGVSTDPSRTGEFAKALLQHVSSHPGFAQIASRTGLNVAGIMDNA